MSKQKKSSKRNGLTYAEAGVDIDAGNAMVEKIKPLVRSTRRPGADGEIGGFGGLFDLKAAGFTDPVLVAANDGVGTKLRIAIESGKHDTIGIDLVAMCVNDLVVQGAEPLFFLDYFATGKLDPDQGAAIVAGIAAGCRQAGCALIGGETAEMPGMYRDGDYDLAGFAVGAAERGQLLPTDDVVEGDVLLGLASSGLHSNGFSLVRRIVAQSGLGWGDAAPFADGRTLADALLEPTRIYVKSILKAIGGTHGVKALAHITGGGFPDNIPRVLPEGLFGRARPCGNRRAAGVFVAGGYGWRAAGGNDAHLQLRHRHDRGGGGRPGGAGRGGAAGGRRDGDADRPHRAAPRRRRHLSRLDRTMSTKRKRTAILISGRGSNMAALIEAASEPIFPAEIVGVISDQPEAPGLTIAASRGIFTQVIARGNFADKAAHDAAIDGALAGFGAEIVALAGYMRVLTAPFVEKWLGRLINIHPALLPSFTGLDTHRRALEAGVRIHGCSVHFVTAQVDNGPDHRASGGACSCRRQRADAGGARAQGRAPALSAGAEAGRRRTRADRQWTHGVRPCRRFGARRDRR